MRINGKWKINYPDVSRAEDKILFDFISNNQCFIGMSPIRLMFITHFDELGEPYGVNFIDDDYNIVSEYSTISIIGEAEVDESLIFSFEMEKISDVDTIPMTHPKGIRLLTKGHKLSKDLEVVPTFEVAETVDITFDETDGSNVHINVVENGIVKAITVNVGISGKPPVTHKVVKDSIMYSDAMYGDSTSYEGEIISPAQPFLAKATVSGTVYIGL